MVSHDHNCRFFTESQLHRIPVYHHGVCVGGFFLHNIKPPEHAFRPSILIPVNETQNSIPLRCRRPNDSTAEHRDHCAAANGHFRVLCDGALPPEWSVLGPHGDGSSGEAG